MIPRDDSADFIPGRMGARGVFGPAGRGDHKLIARKNQFGGNAFARFGHGFLEQSGPTFAL
jgi:hypothetical protein